MWWDVTADSAAAKYPAGTSNQGFIPIRSLHPCPRGNLPRE